MELKCRQVLFHHELPSPTAEEPGEDMGVLSFFGRSFGQNQPQDDRAKSFGKSGHTKN